MVGGKEHLGQRLYGPSQSSNDARVVSSGVVIGVAPDRSRLAPYMAGRIPSKVRVVAAPVFERAYVDDVRLTGT